MLYIAHRTSPFAAPENTVPGILASAGADMVETDWRFNKNNYPVLCHDETFDRTTNVSGPVTDYTLQQTQHVNAADYAPWNNAALYPQFNGLGGDGLPKAKVPYAWDVVNAAKNANLDLLMHVVATPNQVAADKIWYYVNLFGYAGRSIYMAKPEPIAAMRMLYPTQLRYMMIEYPPTGCMRTGEYLQSIGAMGYCVPFTVVSPAFVNYYHSYGLQVYTWTSDTPSVDVVANWQKMYDYGVDGLVTDRPQEAREEVTTWQAG